jgi:hypothetical protein
LDYLGVNNTNIYVTWNSPNAGNFGSFTFDFTTQSFTYTNAVNTSFEALANNWYRLSFTINVTVAGSWNVYYNTLITYAGNASKGYDFYAFQIEAGSYPTSFIPTTNFTAVTRLTDDASKTGISSLIGQTEGVFFMDFEYFADLPTTTYFSIDDVAGDNRVLIYGVSAPDIYGLVQVNGTTQAIFQFTPSSNTRYKIAIAYKANDFAMYLNGTQIGTDSSGSVSWTTPLSRLTYNTSSQYNGQKIYSSMLFPTRLTNEQLQTLTSL